MNYIDANIGWKPSEDAKFDLSVWGRNVTDKRYIASVFDAPGTLGLVNYMPPREFGMTVNYKW
jgi:iron complex outermembrane receptor protein